MIYLGVFVVSVAVLIWDRSTQNRAGSLAQPAQAQRIVTPQKTQTPKKAETPVQADWDLSPGVLNILAQSHRAEHWQDEQNVTRRNLFAPSEKFRSLIESKRTHTDRAARSASQSDKPPEAVELAKQLQMTGILVGPNQSCAVINGRIIFVGQTIGPFRLKRIYGDAVLLQRHKEFILLPIGKLRP